MTSWAHRLTRALAARGIPIDGVSIGDRADRTTWRIDFQSQATTQQRRDAAAIVASFDPNAAQESAKDAAEQCEAELSSRAVRALASATHARFKAVAPTDLTTIDQWLQAIRDAWHAQ